MLTIFGKIHEHPEASQNKAVQDLQTFAELLFHGQKSVEGLEKVKA